MFAPRSPARRFQKLGLEYLEERLTPTGDNVALSETVTPAPVFSPNDQTITIQAKVTDTTNPGTTVNGGTMSIVLQQGANMLGQQLSPGTVQNGVATISYSLPGGAPPGVIQIDALYNPGAGFNGTSDENSTFTLAPAPVLTTVGNVSLPSSSSSQQVTLTATVASSAGSVNEGTVTFTVLAPHGNTVGSPLQAQVHNGLALGVFTVPGGQAAGRYTVEASFSDSGGDFQDGGDVNGILSVTASSPFANWFAQLQNLLRSFQQQERLDDLLSRFEDTNRHLFQNVFAQLEHLNDIALRLEAALVQELEFFHPGPRGL